jgi:hypothetical protein
MNRRREPARFNVTFHGARMPVWPLDEMTIAWVNSLIGPNSLAEIAALDPEDRRALDLRMLRNEIAGEALKAGAWAWNDSYGIPSG